MNLQEYRSSKSIYVDYFNFCYYWELKRLQCNWRAVYFSTVIRNFDRDWIVLRCTDSLFNMNVYADRVISQW